MVKIKRYDSKAELTTKTTAPIVQPSNFMDDLKAVEGLGDFMIKKAEAFQKVRNLNQRTKARIGFGEALYDYELSANQDPDYSTVEERSEKNTTKIVNQFANTIDDEQTRNEFLLFAEGQRRSTMRRIGTQANSRLLKAQKDDYEVEMDQFTKRINQLQFQGNFDDARELAKEALVYTEEMERTGVIFPEVATERVKTLQDAITAKGQAQYEIDNMKNKNDMDIVGLRLEKNLYKLDQKTLSEQREEYKKIKKNLEGDEKDLLDTQYIDNLQKVLNNKEMTPEQQIEVLREAVKLGEAEMPGGVDPKAGRGVIAQIKAQSKTITDQRADAMKIREPAAKGIIKSSYQALNLDDNKKPADTPEGIKQRMNDGKLEDVKEHLKLITTLLNKQMITPETAGEEMAKASELLKRRLTDQEKVLFQEKENASRIIKNRFGLFPYKSKEVAADFIENSQEVLDDIRYKLYNTFMDELDSAESSQEVKNAVKHYKEMFMNLYVPSSLNVTDGVPNGVGSATTPVETINDEPSTAKPDANLKPKKTGLETKIYEKGGIRKRVIFRDGIPIKEEIIE
jgi:hypothetical protein